jgi:prepilin-type N-terminal cleavage/methylation domain-containing protein
MSRFNRKRLTEGKTSCSSGFTLLEVLIAVAILSVGLLGIAGMMATSMRGGAYGRRTTVAENLAIQKLEQFRNLSYTNVKALTEVPSNGVKNPNQCGVGCPAGFTCVANLSSCALKNDPTCILNLAANELISTEIEDYGQVVGDPEVDPGTGTAQTFKRVTVVRALNGCPTPQLESLGRVTVAVSWKGKEPTGQIQEHSVRLGTFISK